MTIHETLTGIREEAAQLGPDEIVSWIWNTPAEALAFCDAVEKLVKRDEPTRPIKHRFDPCWMCPCSGGVGTSLSGWETFCPKCGQRLEWKR